MIRLLSMRTNSMHYFTDKDTISTNLPLIIHEGDYAFFDTWRDIRNLLDFDTKKYLVSFTDDDCSGTNLEIQHMYESRVHVIPGLYSVDAARIHDGTFFIKFRSVRHVETYHINQLFELERIKRMFKDDSNHNKEEE